MLKNRRVDKYFPKKPGKSARTLVALVHFDVGAGVVADGADHLPAAANDAADMRRRNQQPQLYLHHRRRLRTHLVILSYCHI